MCLGLVVVSALSFSSTGNMGSGIELDAGFTGTDGQQTASTGMFQRLASIGCHCHTVIKVFKEINYLPIAW